MKFDPEGIIFLQYSLNNDEKRLSMHTCYSLCVFACPRRPLGRSGGLGCGSPPWQLIRSAMLYSRVTFFIQDIFIIFHLGGAF